MNKKIKARKYNSSILQDLLSDISPLEMEKTKIKMKIAATIEDLIKARGWSKSQFAKKLSKEPSEVSKWLSGNQNFTIDILTEISYTLKVSVNDLICDDASKLDDENVNLNPLIGLAGFISKPGFEKSKSFYQNNLSFALFDN